MKNTMKKTMTAAVYKRYGPPSQISLETVMVPELVEGSILVKVHASSVNRTDCGFLRGKPRIVRLFSGLFKPKSTILGCEFAGEVVAVGPGVTGYSVGNRVFGFKDDDYGFGGHAEYCLMPVQGMIAHIPAHISYEVAAAGMEGSHYALHYIRAVGINSDSNVLVNGGTGAIGSASVQIMKHLGAKVTAVCRGEHKQLLISLGADEVIDYEVTDFTELDRQYDFVFDAVGKSTFGRCRKILTPQGIYMSTELGPYWQNPFLAMLTKVVGQQRVLFPLPENTNADAQYLCDLMEKKAYAPVVDRSYPLSEIVDAYHYVETGMKVGNVVIKISPE